jgi:hypothetical protein
VAPAAEYHLAHPDAHYARYFGRGAGRRPRRIKALGEARAEDERQIIMSTVD